MMSVSMRSWSRCWPRGRARRKRQDRRDGLDRQEGRIISRRMRIALFLAAVLSLSPSALAQPPAVRLAMSGSLRETLERSGFEDAIRTNNGPDLDRKLTSSAFGTSPDTFVAGYYFEDELDGQGLGPLHVSLFDRSRREWA